MFEKTLITLVVLILMLNCFVNITIAEDDKPDLKILDVDSPSIIFEDEEVEIVVQIQNMGDKNISAGQTIKVGLFLDHGSIPVSSNSTTVGLSKDKNIYINISWISTISDEQKHNLSVVVNYDNELDESNYNNNVWDFFVILSEKRTNLEITEISIPDNLEINKKSTIFATITNTGKTKDGFTYVEIKSDKESLIDTAITNKSLARNLSYTFILNWTPSIFGIHKVTFRIYDENVTYDTVEKIVAVGIHEFDWWNESWHYRFFISTDKKGIVSTNLNFTDLLNRLNVSSKDFENDTIRIVHYDSDGEIVEIIDEYWFNESEDFNNENNATGTLVWNASSGSGLRYYLIYFDVQTNPGTRTVLDETENLTASHNLNINETNIADGWWSIINEPLENGFIFKSDPIQINVSTISIANNVSAFVFLSTNISHNFTLYLSNSGGGTKWASDSFYFDLEGPWTVRVICNDSADYEAYVVEHSFYVGKPDLELTNVSFESNLSLDRIYVDDYVNISVNVFCYNASIDNVSVYLSINNSDNINVYNKSVTFDFVKNKNNIVNFFWNTSAYGEYNISVLVDFGDLVNETNETNNALSKVLNVYEIPDLVVEEISLPAESVYEFDKIKIDVTIRNTALGDAIDYEVALYIEKESQGYMKYIIERDRDKITVEANSTDTISLYWDNAIAGQWLVGVKIITDESKRDTNILNNHLLCSQILIVKSYEHTAPVIENVTIQPTTIEQGEIITIIANITDDSGIEKVNITITNPDKVNTTMDLFRATGDTYKCVFDDTLLIGVYSFTIVAVDISVHENFAKKVGNFNVDEETQPPTISYFGAEPIVQLKNKDLEISCFAKDNIGIKYVRVFITDPSGLMSEHMLLLDSGDKYTYIGKYDEYGSYTYYVKVTDNANNFIESENKTFWISSDTKDRDNDGMPDWWEQRYGLDPKTPSDAKEDLDGDGIKNIDEYKGNINPEKDIFIQNAGYRIKNNLGYLGISIVLFIAILLLFIIGRRRLF